MNLDHEFRDNNLDLNRKTGSTGKLPEPEIVYEQTLTET